MRLASHPHYPVVARLRIPMRGYEITKITSGITAWAKLRIPMRGYESHRRLAPSIAPLGYESPCGVMSPTGFRADLTALELRIPMRGYELPVAVDP